LIQVTTIDIAFRRFFVPPHPSLPPLTGDLGAKAEKRRLANVPKADRGKISNRKAITLQIITKTH
jgi:hypothetical protein